MFIPHESLVIGGGPAGAAAAIRLADANRTVQLLERKSGPHDKVCGEFLSWEAVHYLKRLGVDPAALGAQPIHRVRLYDGAHCLDTELPFRASSLTRRRLDEALLQEAVARGATVERGVLVRDLTPAEIPCAPDHWRVSLQDGEEMIARNIFLACGKHDLRRWRRPLVDTSEKIGLKMHLRLKPSQQMKLRGSVEVYLFDQGYAGLEPVEGGVANLCFLISREVYLSCDRSWSGVLHWLGRQSPGLHDRLTGASSLWPSPLAVYGTPYGYVRRISEPGLFCLGDQMAVIPSFAGDGVSMALHSGLLAAECLLDESGSAAYHEQARSDLLAPVRAASRLAWLLSTGQGRRVAFFLARTWPALLRQLIWQVRLERTAALMN